MMHEKLEISIRKKLKDLMNYLINNTYISNVENVGEYFDSVLGNYIYILNTDLSASKELEDIQTRLISAINFLFDSNLHEFSNSN